MERREFFYGFTLKLLLGTVYLYVAFIIFSLFSYLTTKKSSCSLLHVGSGTRKLRTKDYLYSIQIIYAMRADCLTIQNSSYYAFS